LEDQDEDDCKSDELEAENVAEEWIARIDAALLAHTTATFRKVAKIVILAMDGACSPKFGLPRSHVLV
jgi:hypothetical protein